nr:immunoglobulin heavy chain junction region [Mus musculus]NSM04101.1 immunoglobulin heavy chain junction region [Mus musculus]NSM05182.1 immunoglobulin heavy chain junction region [Mus musculus]NSM05367.1 immunoglobulin heavy chain junction region [Mus musculus]NSM08582.1 immunoglobulin heavy chain junction region [Mus musculus]
CARGGYYKGYW